MDVFAAIAGLAVDVFAAIAVAVLLIIVGIIFAKDG